MTITAVRRCTYHQAYGPNCGKAPTSAVHPQAGERKMPGMHVWRHDPKDARRAASTVPSPPVPRDNSEDYQRGYDSGYHAGYRRAVLSPPRSPVPVPAAVGSR